MSDGGYIVGLDMGGTNIRCAAVSSRGKVMLLVRGPAKATSSAAALVDNLAAHVHALEHAAHGQGLGRCRAVGVAVPGPLNVRTGIVYTAPHVKAWRSFPLKRRLEERLGRRVTLENDANAWALGERWRGAARGYQNVVLLALGTGVGGGIIVGGKIVHGKTGMAGELGHVPVEPNGAPCECGSFGCLEAYASASGMCRLLGEKLGSKPAGKLPECYLDGEGEFSVRRMTVEARRGDGRAREVFAAAGRYLGIAIAGFMNIFNPELVVIGGGVAGALPFMRVAMIREVRARAFSPAVKQARIVTAALGAHSGVIGAAYAAVNAIKPV